MAYREVGMIEVREVLRQWLEGGGKKTVARRVGLDAKTARRYIAVAEGCGLKREAGIAGLTDELFGRILLEMEGWRDRERGETWALCESRRGRIQELLEEDVRLTKVARLLGREGTEVPYSTLYRFSKEKLGFGKATPTIAVLEGEPGQELQVDTGTVGWLWGEGGKRKLKAWIFTATRSRHRFVYPTLTETTADAIEACEAAWRFYGGVFRVLLPDNTSAIVEEARNLGAQIQQTFLEYAQARGFVVDPARAGHPKDKARVERSVSHVRDDCFGGEKLKTLEEARTFAEEWCLRTYGSRRHSRTQRSPLEHFLAEEKERLLPAPVERYDTPRWGAATVDRDQYIQVEKALYSVPARYVRRKLTTRADSSTVRLYEERILVKVHARVAPGQRATDVNDFPEAQRIYAHRDADALKRKAAEIGPCTGELIDRILDDPRPWTRMRMAYALVGLARKYGEGRLEETCRLALEAGMHDVTRVRRLLERGTCPDEPRIPARVVPIARYLRPHDHFALRRER